MADHNPAKDVHQVSSQPRNTSAESKYSHTISQSQSMRAANQENENNNIDAKESSSPKSCQDESTCNMTVEDKEAVVHDEALQEDNGRERLKRYRTEMAGRVWIPDSWGQEDLLKDWIDCSVFEASLVHSGIMSARAALVQDSRKANSSRLRIDSRS